MIHANLYELVEPLVYHLVNLLRGFYAFFLGIFLRLNRMIVKVKQTKWHAKDERKE